MIAVADRSKYITCLVRTGIKTVLVAGAGRGGDCDHGIAGTR